MSQPSLGFVGGADGPVTVFASGGGTALLVYLVLVFFSTSAFFLWKLLHRDIIASLRNLQGGE